jgi:hypothetical protein
MKKLSGPAFFRLFDMLISVGNPGLKLDRWTIADVQIERERHSYSGRTHCFALDMFTLTRTGGRSWKLLVAKEFWWDGHHERAIRVQVWSRPLAGNRRDILAWMRDRELELRQRQGVFVDHREKSR